MALLGLCFESRRRARPRIVDRAEEYEEHGTAQQRARRPTATYRRSTGPSPFPIVLMSDGSIRLAAVIRFPSRSLGLDSSRAILLKINLTSGGSDVLSLDDRIYD
jgi:hypothetical protein